jgi:hypothetical protein
MTLLCQVAHIKTHWLTGIYISPRALQNSQSWDRILSPPWKPVLKDRNWNLALKPVEWMKPAGGGTQGPSPRPHVD